MSEPVRILMVDDHPVVLAGLKAVVETNCNLRIVGEAQDGRTALALARTLKPDVLVLDLSLPGPTGLEVAAIMRDEVPCIRILVLTVHEDGSYVQEAMRAAAAGYLLKRSAANELIRAIHVVAAGGIYLDPTIAGKALGRGNPAPAVADLQMTALSEREGDVLRLLAEGHSNKEVAATLSISMKTVETYKSRGMEKLGFRTRVDLVRYAAQHGWLRGG